MTTGASVALLRPGGEVLLLQRSVRAGAGGRWNLPGGGREAGEGSLQAALSEAEEEAGFRLRPGDLVVGRLDQPTYVTWVVRLGRPYQVRVNWESTAWGWWTPEVALQQLDVIDPQRPVLSALGRM